ncbi:MAG TPA: S9 family peptidase [Novosphingobium sp.]|nr:S9 family peptidase [Novosphingobium sp.]
MRTKLTIAGLVLFGALGSLHLSTKAQAQSAASSLPASPAPAVPSPTPPVEAFARIPFVEDAEISPNGGRLAGLFGIGGEQKIGVLSLFAGSEIPVMLRVPEGTQAAWVRWVNDDNIIIGLRTLLPIDVGERWYVSQAIAINRVSGKITKLMWDLNGQNTDLVWVASNGSPEVLMAVQNSIYIGDEFWPAVYRVNVETGSKRRVVDGRTNVSDWAADGQGNVRTGVGYRDDSRTFSLLYRSAGGGQFRTIDRANSRKREALFNPVLFLPGTEHALAIHDDEQGRAGVFEVDLPTQADVRAVFTAPAGADIGRLVVSDDGTTLLGLTTTAATDNVHWFDPALGELQASFNKAIGDRSARIVSLSRDRQRMLVVLGRPDTPGAFYYYDTAGGKLHRVAIMNEALGTRPLAPVKMIHYTARDGTGIDAVLTLPNDREAKALPIVMLPHGGPWAQDTASYDYWAQFIASRGYAVLQPNFRGSTGYSEEFLRKGEGQMGLAMQDDITDGLNWAVSQGIADPKRACIVGASYGGYAAMWGVAKDPELYRCAISIAGVASIRAEVNDFGQNVMAGKFRDDWKRMTPDFAAVSPINAVARITAPLLLIHGKRDVTVDHDQSSKMYGRMREAGKQVEFLSLPLADHYFTRQEDRLQLLSAIESFLARHNPAGAPPVAQASNSSNP